MGSSRPGGTNRVHALLLFFFRMRFRLRFFFFFSASAGCCCCCWASPGLVSEFVVGVLTRFLPFFLFRDRCFGGWLALFESATLPFTVLADAPLDPAMESAMKVMACSVRGDGGDSAFDSATPFPFVVKLVLLPMASPAATSFSRPPPRPLLLGRRLLLFLLFETSPSILAADWLTLCALFSRESSCCCCGTAPRPLPPPDDRPRPPLPPRRRCRWPRPGAFAGLSLDDA
mmetsp:Transcript_7959/g.14643  ORF Transcript_7959/g.14643 Transcript_7959/m.14643 type:complete len:230 (-) Transcript_7959:156-845(-)